MTYKPSIPLTKQQLDYIFDFKHVFLKVQDATGVPWEAVAGIWTRESFSVASPRTPGGPFQFDPPLDFEAIAKLLHQYTNLDAATITAMSKKGINDFETAAYCCACWLRKNCKPVLKPASPDADIRDAIYGYNGRSYGSVFNSPYVMNGFDEQHKDMHLRGTIPIPGSDRRKQIDIIDKRPGAFTVYKMLRTDNRK